MKTFVNGDQLFFNKYIFFKSYDIHISKLFDTQGSQKTYIKNN